jgi:hypothetical protein
LVQSGPETREWLRRLQEDLPDLEYREATYYASFRGLGANGAIAYLNPAKKSIRLFVRLDPTDDPHLARTPSSHHWAQRFPSIFTIRNDSELPVARRLIERSHIRARQMS